MTKCIGLIGTGAWGKYILRDLLSLKAKVLVVGRQEKTREAALQQGAHGAYATVEEIADRVDGFVVATPTITHADVLDGLLAYDKPIFVEKPLTSDLDRARKLLKSGKENIFVMNKWRYHPGVDALAEHVRKEILGEIQFIKTCRLGWGNPHHDVDALWILLPHDLSIIQHILGYIPSLKSVTPYLKSDPSVGVMVALKDDYSPTVMIEMSTIKPLRQRSVCVVGSNGSMELGGAYDTELTLIKGSPAALNPVIEKISVSDAMPLYLELKVFLDYLNGGTPPYGSLEEAVRVVETIHEVKTVIARSISDEAIPNANEI